MDDAELRRALRAALLRVEEVHADLLRLAARVVALEESLAASAPDDAARTALAAAIDARETSALAGIRAADAASLERLLLDPPVDKYAVTTDDPPPCAELLALCGARCCSFSFALTSQDLDEGVIAFDAARPYLIRHEPDGQCSHLDRATHGCEVYAQRPAVCRQYDCRQDARVWIDYAARTPAPWPQPPTDDLHEQLDLYERARRRELALAGESRALRGPRR